MTKGLKQWRVREELKLEILKLIYSFKSKEEPSYKKLTVKDIIAVLAEIIKDKV